jgi:hypothetical protein
MISLNYRTSCDSIRLALSLCAWRGTLLRFPIENQIEILFPTTLKPQPLMFNLNKFVSAAWDGDYDLVCSLLSEGRDINQKNSYGDTALIVASANGHERVVTLLIERGAILDIQNNVSIL